MPTDSTIELTATDYAWAERLAFRYCRTRGVAKDPEIEQAVRVALWETSLRYVPGRGASFHTYSSKRLRFVVIDIIRERLGRGIHPGLTRMTSLDARLPGKSTETLADTLAHRDGDPVKNTAAAFLLDDILARCDARQKSIVRLLAKGLSQKEVAKEIGTAPHNVTRAIKRLRERLRERFPAA